MPRAKKIYPEETQQPEQGSEISRFLPDGRRPNPQYFTNDDRGFEDFQAALDEKDIWGEYIAYLYRVAPRRTPTDKEARVTTFVQTLTIAEITKKYGGKKWSVFLNHGAGGKTSLVKKFQFDIEANPIWQDDETPETPAARAKGQPAATDNGDAKADPLVVKAFDDLIAQRDRALSEGQTFDAGEALSKSVALMNTGFTSALTSVTANLGKGDSGLAAVLVPLLTEMIKSNRKEDPILQTLLTRALERPADPFATITGMLTLLKELGVKIGPGSAVAAGGGSDWAAVVEKLVDRAPDLLASAARLVPQRSSGPVPVPRPALPAAVPFPAPVVTARVAQPAANNPAPANLASESAPEEAGQPAAEALSPELADRIAQNVVKAAIVRMLFAGDSGDDAAHYAEMAHEPLARTLAEMLKKDPAALQSDPILSQAITHVNVMAFAKEFVDYFEEEEPSRAREEAVSETTSPA